MITDFVWNEFIPVKEKLPTENGEYEVVTRITTEYTSGTFISRMDFRDGEWIPKKGAIIKSDYVKCCEVVFWINKGRPKS